MPGALQHTTDADYGLPTDEQEEQTLTNLWTQSFISPPGVETTYLDRVGRQNCRVLRRQGNVAAGLAMLPMRQWFGGRQVAMTGIASVGVAPEYRGSGVANALLRHTLTELHQTGVPISTLYPAAQTPYRQVGYEQGGFYCRWSVNPGSIGLRRLALPVYPMELSAENFWPTYQNRAQASNGNLARHPMLWHQLTHPKTEGEMFYAYGFGNAQQPEGYIIFQQQSSPTESTLRIIDWALLTAAATQTFWAFLFSHRSQIDAVYWIDGVIPTISLCLPEQIAKQRSAMQWLVRVVDVVRALATRGYPEQMAAELHLEIKDDVLPANSDRFVMQVEQGNCQVKRGGTGSFKTTINGLASLYTSLFSARQLRQSGLAEAEDGIVTIADQIFSGTCPWMSDFF
jgi:predicted acetyltransferase